MKEEGLIIGIIIILIIIPTAWVIQHNLNSGMDNLKKYGVYSLENEKINNKNITIIYQIKHHIPSKVPNNIDPQSKVEITYITWYIFNHYNYTNEVQIICYYNDSSNLKEYYKFKIDRENAKLSGILNISEEDLHLNIYHYYRKIIKLGMLKIRDENLAYWRRVNYAYNNTN